MKESGKNKIQPAGNKSVKIKCWEALQCNETACPAYKSGDPNCWLFSGTHCHKNIQGKFIEKMEMCSDCDVYRANMDYNAMHQTCKIINRQFKEFAKLVKERDNELENTGLELALSISEVLEALKRISAGDPDVRIPETSSVELISRLKRMVNVTAENIGEIVDQSHEFAMGLAEHFDVLHRVTQGDLNARISGSSPVELIEALKEVSNKMISSVDKEITERKKVEETLRESEKRYRDLFENTTDLIQIITPDGRFLFVNAAWMVSLGYFEEDILRLTIWDVIHPDNLSQCRESFQQVLSGKNMQDIEVTFVAKTGKFILAEGNINCFFQKSEPEYIRCIFHDITERKRMEEDLRTMSLRDELTGLYNRRGLVALAEQQLKIADRMKRGILLLFADLDGMKFINDTFGHQEGDRALIDTTNILKDTFRGSDIIARVGGDEFVVLALETNETYCDLFANRLKAIFDAFNKKGERGYTLTLSVGIAHYDPENPCSIDALLKRADNLMYKEKKKRRE